MKMHLKHVMFPALYFIFFYMVLIMPVNGAEQSAIPVLVADLSGQEVHGTMVRGKAEFHLVSNGEELSYKLTLPGSSSFTSAHIHMAPEGKSGPAVVVIFDADEMWKESFTVEELEGIITAADMIGPLTGTSFSRLLREMAEGYTYIDFHSDQKESPDLSGHIVYPSSSF